MTDWTLVVLAAIAAVVLIIAITSWRDVRVSKHTGTDPRVHRDARRATGGQEGQG